MEPTDRQPDPLSESVLELTPDELAAAVRAAGQPDFRAKQIAEWIYDKGVADPAEMTNLPAGMRERLTVLTSRVAARADSRDGTVKLLIELGDGERIECVLIPTGSRSTACVSTQVGCAMGCAFCASGMDGVRRDLTAGEILQQLLHLQRETGRKVTHVVFMGTGEPLTNYDATVAAVRAILDADRFHISARRVTVSTVGIPKAIRRLAGEDLPITLAISLHAPTDALRRRIVPAAARWSIADVLDAAREFFRTRGREVTLEYVLLGGVNDTPECAERLASLAGSLRCNVNLIRYNPVADADAGAAFSAPEPDAVTGFAEQLSRRGVNVQVRRSRGLDAAAACGQLRRRSPGESTEGTP